jgi:hypothetical protein
MGTDIKVARNIQDRSNNISMTSIIKVSRSMHDAPRDIPNSF